MGAALSTESVLTTAVVVGAVAVGYHQYTTAPSAGSSSAAKPKKKKKGPEQKKTVDASSLPGQFEVPSSTPAKPKKAKKKTTITESNPQPPAQQSTTSIDTDGSWTRVESRKKVGQGGELGSIRTVDITTTSDAGITPSVTESSVDEDSGDKRTTVDDMLPGPPSPARVMRIQSNEQPIPGFSWKDYEEFQEGNDADGEDDGWGVVQRKGSRPNKTEQLPVAQQPQGSLTQKQRQNASKREAQKSAKAAAEAERLATLAKHKNELERIRIIEQSRSSKKGKTSGGMTSVVDDRGKLVWE